MTRCFFLEESLPDKKATITKIMYCDLGRKIHTVESAQAGQLVALEGIDKILNGAGTLGNDESASAIKYMHFSVTPVVRRGIEPKDKRLQKR